MHIAASRPVCVTTDDVPEDVVAKEKEVFMAQAAESGKPPEIIEKMITGRINKFLNEVALEGQAFVKDPDQKVGKLLKSENASVQAFARLEVGEGIEKKVEDFAAEVAAQAKGA
jgi:elongation factor Ts